jgi:branched-chain amino acid transport system permease protein
MADFVQTLITTLEVGSLYALIALGYTMVYGILKFINFAHSDIVVLGAWSSFTLASWILPAIGLDPHNPATPPPMWVGGSILLTAMMFCGLVGYLIERFAYRPLRNAPRLNVLITAIGVSLFLQNVGQLDFVFGPSPQKMPALLPNWSVLSFTFAEAGGTHVISIGLVDVILFVTAAVLMLGLEYLVFRTKLGTAMRAVSYSPTTAALMGIPVDRVVSFTFVLGSALAAAAGFLYAMKYPGLNQPAHTIWVLLGLKAFVAAVIGGIGNVRGAVVGGFVIAFVEQFGSYYVSSNYRDVYVFALLILILLVLPTGLLGSPVRDKV